MERGRLCVHYMRRMACAGGMWAILLSVTGCVRFLCAWCRRGVRLRVVAHFINKESSAERTWKRKWTPSKLPILSSGERESLVWSTTFVLRSSCAQTVETIPMCRKEIVRVARYDKFEVTGCCGKGRCVIMFTEQNSLIVYELRTVHKERCDSFVLFEKWRCVLRRRTRTDAFLMLWYMFAVVGRFGINSPGKSFEQKICVQKRIRTLCCCVLLVLFKICALKMKKISLYSRSCFLMYAPKGVTLQAVAASILWEKDA